MVSPAGAGVTLPAATATLAWTHSIEKIRWEEDWRAVETGDGGVLVLEEARVRGHGAGMEPPAGAVLDRGVWRYRPALPPQAAVRLAHSPYAAPYVLCAAGECRSLEDWLPGGMPEHAVVELRPCPGPE
ncbi:MAG: DUF1850 domain-containing protein [Rhodocyclaceae bacterium]|nr:DUF1850 domain-containing protein [Rhodocyclaceae bacterium]